MDTCIIALLDVMGSAYGSDGLRYVYNITQLDGPSLSQANSAASGFRSTFAFHSCLLRIHRPDALFRSRRKSLISGADEWCIRIDYHQLRNTLLTFISSIVQLAALVWYLISYFPLGSTGLRFAARFGGNRVAAWMGD